MRKLTLYILVILLSVFQAERVYSQTDTSNLSEEEKLALQLEKEANIDSLGVRQKRVEKKPFQSYLFPDSLKYERMFAWTYDSYTNTANPVPVDTMLTSFNQEYFFQRKAALGSTYLGNIGAPTSPIEYSSRYDDYKLAFLNAYKEYLVTPENAIFYNSKVAFSQFSYFTSGQSSQAEEIFNLTHAQNISPSSGINLTYRNNRTRGIYTNQQSINKNFSMAFSHTGKRYTTHMGYVFNSGDIEENGGISDMSEITDTVINLTQNISVNLEDAKTKFKGNGLFHSQTLAIPLGKGAALMDSLRSLEGIVEEMTSLDSIKMLRRQLTSNSSLSSGPMLFIGTSISYDSYKKIYTDTKAETKDGYYENWYISTTMSRDSIRETNLSLKLFTQLQPFNREGILGLIGGGIGYENNGYYYFKPDSYLITNEKEQKKSLFIYGDAAGQWSKYLAWSAGVKYYALGYRNQDISMNGKLAMSAYINNRPITLSGGVEFITQSPSYWDTEFYSNHYKWTNDFNKEVKTNINAKLSIPSINFNLGLTQCLGTDIIYYDSNSLPAQYGGALSVTELFVEKEFIFGGLHLQNKVLFQTTSNEEVAPVPDLAVNIQYFYRFHVVKGILEMEVGFNGRYTTAYYGYGFNPAISQFYNQREIKTGDYPMFDLFATGKWKRLRFIVKMQNANYDLFGGNKYFDTAYYPLNRSMIKYGVSWSFYN